MKNRINATDLMNAANGYQYRKASCMLLVFRNGSSVELELACNNLKFRFDGQPVTKSEADALLKKHRAGKIS